MMSPTHFFTSMYSCPFTPRAAHTTQQPGLHEYSSPSPHHITFTPEHRRCAIVLINHPGPATQPPTTTQTHATPPPVGFHFYHRAELGEQKTRTRNCMRQQITNHTLHRLIIFFTFHSFLAPTFAFKFFFSQAKIFKPP